MICEGWEGSTVDGKFPLLEWLGGWSGRCVFLTVRQGTQRANIKLIVASGGDAEGRLARWETAKGLLHPFLVHLMESGRYTIQGTEVVYLVTEKSDAFLSGIIPRKALDAPGFKVILDPVVDALSFLHEKGLAYGSVKPSNIVLIGHEWKLASDEMVGSSGTSAESTHQRDTYDAPEIEDGKLTPAADLWSLGIIVVEGFTQRTPTWDRDAKADLGVPAWAVPEPFLQIARGCLRWNPAERISIEDVKALLASAPSTLEREESTGLIPEHAEPVPEHKEPVPVEVRRVEAEPKREEKKIAVEPVDSFSATEPVEFTPRTRMFTNLEDEEEHTGRKGSIAVAILVLLAVAAVFAVRGFRGRLFSSGETQNVSPQRQSAPQTAEPQKETNPSQAAPANASQPETQTQPQAGDSTPPSQTPSESQPPQTEKAPAVIKPEPAEPPAAKSESAKKPETVAPESETKSKPKTEAATAETGSDKGEVVKRVMPSVEPGAIGSMRRPVDVELRVSVSESGAVSSVEYMTMGPGNYFARKAHQAAEAWRFKPPQTDGQAAASQWVLLFRFERRRTDVTATRVH